MDQQQFEEYDVLVSEIKREFIDSEWDVCSMSIYPDVGRIEVGVDIMRDKYDSDLIKRFAEKDLRLSRKHPNIRIHFEYWFVGLPDTIHLEIIEKRRGVLKRLADLFS